jgi:hypothetical protein
MKTYIILALLGTMISTTLNAQQWPPTEPAKVAAFATPQLQKEFPQFLVDSCMHPSIEYRIFGGGSDCNLVSITVTYQEAKPYKIAKYQGKDSAFFHTYTALLSGGKLDGEPFLISSEVIQSLENIK